MYAEEFIINSPKFAFTRYLFLENNLMPLNFLLDEIVGYVFCRNSNNKLLGILDCYERLYGTCINFKNCFINFEMNVKLMH